MQLLLELVEGCQARTVGLGLGASKRDSTGLVVIRSTVAEC